MHTHTHTRTRTRTHAHAHTHPHTRTHTHTHTHTHAHTHTHTRTHIDTLTLCVLQVRTRQKGKRVAVCSMRSSASGAYDDHEANIKGESRHLPPHPLPRPNFHIQSATPNCHTDSSHFPHALLDSSRRRFWRVVARRSLRRPRRTNPPFATQPAAGYGTLPPLGGHRIPRGRAARRCGGGE